MGLCTLLDPLLPIVDDHYQEDGLTNARPDYLQFYSVASCASLSDMENLFNPFFSFFKS